MTNALQRNPKRMLVIHQTGRHDQADRYSTSDWFEAFVHKFANILANIAFVAKVALSLLLPIRVAKNVALCMTTTCCLPPSSPSILLPSLSQSASLCSDYLALV